MSENFYTILTNAGLAAIANAVINQTQVNFAKLGVGDGNGAYYTPTQEATALRNQVWIGNISSVTADTTNPNWVNVETVIPGNVGGFEIRELGIFDDNNVLLAIGKLPLTYKPNFAEGSSKDLYIKAIFEVTNANAVTLKVDPSVIYASKKYVDDKVAAVVSGLENIQQQLNQKTAAIDTKLGTHIADYVKHPAYAGTTFASNVYSVNLDPPLTAYKDGVGLVLKLNTTPSAGTIGINVDGLGNKSVYRAKGTSANASMFVKDGIYEFRYSATANSGNGAFILQGEGGSGNAQPSDVRTGKTFTNDDGEKTGTLVAYGISEQVPMDKLQCSLANIPVVQVFGDMTDTNSFYPAKSIHYDYNNSQYHAIGLGGHKKFSWAGGLMGSLTLNTASYVFAFDEEHGFIYLMYSDTKIAKVNAATLAVIWETPQYSGLNAASAAHVPNNQGVAIAVSATNTFQCTGYNKDGQQKWRLNYNAHLGAHRAMCADRAGDVYLAAQNTETNVTSLYKISGATGAVMVVPVSIYTGYYSAYRMMVDETNGRLVILFTDGNIRSYRTYDLAIVFTMPNAQLTSGGVSLDIDKKGNVYIGVRGGNVNLYGDITPGVVKFSPTLSYMWRMGNTIMNYPSDISIAIDKHPDKEYPDIIIALPKSSGSVTNTVRYKQTIAVKS